MFAVHRVVFITNEIFDREVFSSSDLILSEVPTSYGVTDAGT
jgi:hypothetical protein